ncbi:ABC transporter permease [Sporosarcina sp. Marseille-Q4063]|uniref:ABC transporter permease n=1 Tax=Sporosarcina sp. Marseille-Q4063 TaxID=2810514 RepID=UPI001BAF4885|nr:ABC transporter permease [Sporosarcina sp. Marseille-Q4063]QUW22411.1 ABC transporter permease [Sporosarcina sp. Marseille-Q4063]
MIAFTKRNILLYFRDRTAVFFSLLAVFILIALYVLFLGDLTSKGLPDFPAKKQLLTSWFIAGILAVSSMTTTLGSFGILVEDRANNRVLDFHSSPISRAKLVGGYISSALFIGFFMCAFTFIVAEIFLFLSGEPLLTFDKGIMLVGVILLSVVSSGSMVLLVVSFFKTSNAFAAASTIIGTLLGFLAGIYIPIGTLPDYLQTIVKFFPVSHSAALFRQILMDTSLIDAFSNASPTLKETFLFDMGVNYKINGEKATKLFSVFYLIGTTILFFILSILVMNRKQK